MMATKNPFQGDDKDFFEAARDESGEIKREAPKSDAPKKQSFSQAFASARRAGDKTFMFEGKKFSTARADDKKSPPPTPSLSVSKQRDLDKTESRRAAQENMRAIAASRAARAKTTESGERVGPTKARAAMENKRKDELRSSGPMKAGGKVKKYAEGGSVSARADGIAKRGKTKCKII